MSNPVVYVLLISGGLAAVFCAVALSGLLAFRHRAYRRHVKYDTNQECLVGFPTCGVESVSVRCNGDGFIMPELSPLVTAGFLELSVQATITGRIFDPCIEIEANGFHDVQFLERGVRGARCLNVSRLLAAGIASGESVSLRGRGMIWKPSSALLHLCSEELHVDDRILVVAPHPDDAEIAAFGLYSAKGATVVTISAGDDTKRYDGDVVVGVSVPRTTVARMRVWDSITVPQLGRVGPERAVNLCFPDGRLKEMHSTERKLGPDARNGIDFFPGLRELNLSRLVRSDGECSWSGLISDLAHIISETTPTIIATPHPGLDPHPDHVFTTVAVCEALQQAGLKNGRFFFYLNHNRHSELWPFGPAGSGVALPPILASDVIGCEGFWSHSLSTEQQCQKFLALEAMHETRDLSTPLPLSLHKYLRQIKSGAGALLNGLGLLPTSYFRRAVRPDELFFTTSFTMGQQLCRRLVGDN